jgi:hypothetical protein
MTFYIFPAWHNHAESRAKRVTFQFTIEGGKRPGPAYVTVALSAKADLLTEASKAAKAACAERKARSATLWAVLPELKSV